MQNQSTKTHGIDALRLPGESCSDIELASRAIYQFGNFAAARFCARQGIALEDFLVALRNFDFWISAKIDWIPE